MKGLIEGLMVDKMVLLDSPGPDALFQECEAEYALNAGAMGCWITVDSLSVRLRREAGRLVVQIFPLLDEGQTAIAELEVENPTPF